MAALCIAVSAAAQDDDNNAAPRPDDAAREANGFNTDPANGPVTVPPLPASDQLTLEILIQQGGPILWIIMGLGFIALVMTLYFMLTITPRREAPQKLIKLAREQLRAGELRELMQMCEGRDELLARVLYAGVRMADHDRYVILESMESEGQRGATALWQRISYLNNIGVIAPLLGLLGTVWGMIGAFNSIALDSAQVKGLTMAYYVSQAMITTAGGLLLAIPCMMVYYYLRGRVVKIVARVESQATDFVDLILRNQER